MQNRNIGNLEIELLELIKKMISFKTTPKNFTEFKKTVKFIRSYFSDRGVTINEHWFNGFPALFITTRETKRPKLLFQGHLDVVNGKEEQFTPRIEGNKLYGRGSVDMKSFVALAMKFVKDNPDLDVGLIITFDEEIGSENGAKKMVELGYSAELLFNGDGGYNYSVIYGEKGILKFEMKTEANPDRHPYPWKGKNAFDLFVDDYKKLEKIFSENGSATDEDNWHTTYAVYDVKVHNKEFYTPDLAEAKITIYFTEDITTDELIEKIKREFKYSEITPFVKSERVFINPDSPYALELKKIMEKNFGREIALRTENGSSDARFYANAGIPIVIVKMVGEDHHGDNEHILIDKIMPMYKSMEEFALGYLRKENKEELSYVKEA